MKRILIPLCFALALVIGFATGWFVGTERNPPPLYDKDVSLPDAEVLSAVEKGVMEVLTDRDKALERKGDWTIHKDDARGTIETSWFREHKGEVELKAVVKVWGRSYHIDVWQRTLTGEVQKTYWSRKFERMFEDNLRKRMVTKETEVRQKAAEQGVPPDRRNIRLPVNSVLDANR